MKSHHLNIDGKAVTISENGIFFSESIKRKLELARCYEKKQAYILSARLRNEVRIERQAQKIRAFRKLQRGKVKAIK